MRIISNATEALQILQHEVITKRLGRGIPVAVLTGAGISTDSGIPDYRGPNGTYVRYSDYKPIRFQEFMASDLARKRYWARSFVGYPEMMKAKPNLSHYALAELRLPLITQNVDSLHTQAGSSDCTELHGSLKHVVCTKCGKLFERSWYQDELKQRNPSLSISADSIRPDGDVDLGSFDYSQFRYPSCPCSQSAIIKPDVVFFGENVQPKVRDASFTKIDISAALLVVGSSLQVYSAFRLVKRALDQMKHVIILTNGETRAERGDTNDALITKLEVPCGEVLPGLASFLE